MNFDDLVAQGYKVKEQEIAGDLCALVCPEGFDNKWTPEMMIYRSSVWRKSDGFPVSLSFRKFFNFGEQIQMIPDPTNLDGTSLLQKIDGSALIISKYKGQLILRTRETFDAYIHGNASELDELKIKYPLLFNSVLLDKGFSIITEWVSPTNVIVLHYPEPDIYLTGIINHSNYEYLNQDALDDWGKNWGVKRPERYQFAGVNELIETVKEWHGKEGICLYFNDDQDIKKIKSLDYLAKHAFKSDMSLKNMLKTFFGIGKPQTFKDFYENIEKTFDFECANMAIPMISKVIDAHKEAQKIFSHMSDEFIPRLKGLSRKDAAMKIIESYGKSVRSGIAFTMLDGKPITDKELEKVMQQFLQ
jgi:hypothetical protein